MTPRQARTSGRPPVRPTRLLTLALILALAAGDALHAGADAGPAPSLGAPDTLSTPVAGVPAAAGSSFTAPPPGHDAPGGAFRADRLSHASLALAIGVGVGLTSGESAAGAGTAVALAVAKELLDERVDRGDLAAGAVGAALAWLIVAALTR